MAPTYMSILNDVCIKLEMGRTIYHQLYGGSIKFRWELLNVVGVYFIFSFQIEMVPQKKTKNYTNEICIGL
jgi:hypothetical protein